MSLRATDVAGSIPPIPMLNPAALGVFCRFQVADFDFFLGFFSLCHFIFSFPVRFLTLLPVRSLLNAVMILLSRLGVDLGTDVWDYPALGVFFRFQVSDFNRRLGFFSLCHFIFPSYLLWVVSRCVVSVTPKGN